MSKLISILFILIAALIGVVLAQTKKDSSKSNSQIIEKAAIKCNVKAYRYGLANDELKTSNIRVAPDKNSEIVKKVATKDEVVYSISGNDSNGWFEISKIETIGGDEDKTLFEGSGWVHSSLLSLSVGNGDPKLWSAPNKKRRVLKKLVPDESEARPIACQGDWMKIRSGKQIGWLSSAGQCANPLTTCS